MTPSPASTRPLERPQVPALTGLRFLAALLVLVGHVGRMTLQFPGESDGFILFWAATACLGMSLFFMLSGFIIAHTYRREAGSLARRAVLRFYSRRLARCDTSTAMPAAQNASSSAAPRSNRTSLPLISPTQAP